MSRTGNCDDNAVAERVFWSLEHDWTNQCMYSDLEAARQNVFRYIELFYNTIRRHQTPDSCSPAEVEACFRERTSRHTEIADSNNTHSAV